ncbi:MAG: hypothetical protein KDC66_08465 [Phaeodactylibacter sp.]|nr:hypothetical protein [Phaeodactylibacter sp.]MCB9273488.1 hypothetical protein [Lewinellaceae bacterium]
MRALNLPADKAFRSAMYNGVILDNWELEYYSTHFEDEASFQEVIGAQSALAQWTALQVEQLSNEKFSNSKAAELAGELIRRAYIDSYANPHYGAIALAFWFYQFDADNWFSFEQVRKEAEKYLGYYPDWDNRLELHLFKGFEYGGVLARAITGQGLPVVVNYSERRVTIWVAQLND